MRKAYDLYPLRPTEADHQLVEEYREGKETHMLTRVPFEASLPDDNISRYHLLTA